MLWWKGAFRDGRAFQLLAVLQGVDLGELRLKVERAVNSDDAEQLSYDEVLDRRARASLDLQLRESAMDKAIEELMNLELRVKTEKDRYTTMRDSFNGRLEELEKGLQDPALMEVRRSIERMHPRQAKGVLERMIETGEPDTAVAIVRGMTPDKQGKIFKEFKPGVDEELIDEILERILSGEPEASLIQDARRKLKDFAPD